MGVVSIER